MWMLLSSLRNASNDVFIFFSRSAYTFWTDPSLSHPQPPCTTVPSSSPMRTRLILPLTVRLKTMIGNLLSMHSEIAGVHDLQTLLQHVQIRQPREHHRIFIKHGSTLYTPSTLVAFKITSAPISTARREAVVSVVKKGLPLPLQRSRLALLKVANGSTPDVGLCDLVHLNGGLQTCRDLLVPWQHLQR